MIVPQIVVVHLVSRSLPAFGVVSRVPSPFHSSQKVIPTSYRSSSLNR